MTSLYCGFTIEHDRSHAFAWRGERTDRTPDVVAQDLPSALHIIDVILDDEQRHEKETPVVPV